MPSILTSTPGRASTGNDPFALAPAGSILWPKPSFYGYSKSTVSSITMGTIYTNVTAADAPFVLYASASAVTAVGGTLTLSGKTLSAYMHLEHKWTLTYNDDSPVASDGEIIDPNELTPVNMYTDQIGGEAVFILHEPGTYKLTLTTTSANGVSEVATKTITANVPTYAHKWFDPASGDNANDGKDPHGFALTNASYTESSGALTQTGFFASYDHAAATSETYLTDNSNWIWLDWGASSGWKRIASKTDSNTIVLLDKIGSDQTGVTSSDGAKASFDPGVGGTIEANTAHHLRARYTYPCTGGISIEDTDGIRVQGFGGPGNYTLKAAAAISLVDYVVGYGDVAGDRIYVHKGTLDGAQAEGIGGNAFYGSMGGNGDTSTVHVLQDRCAASNVVANRPLLLQGQPGQTIHWCCWATYLDNRPTNGEVKRSTIFAALNNASHSAVVGCRFSAGTVFDNIRDHHTYITGFHHHRLRAFNDAYHNGDASFFFNENCGPTDGGSVSKYVTFVGNRLRNCRWGIDGSNTSNDDTSTFDEYVIIRNAFDGTDNYPFGGIFPASLDRVFVGHNLGIGLARDLFETLAPQYSLGNEYQFDNNLAYNCEIVRLYSGLGDYEVVGGIAYRIESDANVLTFSTEDNGADTYFQDIQVYTPNDADGDIFHNDVSGGGSEDLATFNGRANNAGNFSGIPGWANPDNGDFR